MAQRNHAAVIVEAQLEDVPAIHTIVKSAYTKYIERIGKPPAPMLADYTQLIQSHDVYVLKSAADGSVQGSIVLAADKTDSDVLKINNVVVHPDAQGKGYGRLLMHHAEDVARAQGRTVLGLFTNLKMHENLSLYPKLGFIETERRTEDGYERVFFRRDLV